MGNALYFTLFLKKKYAHSSARSEPQGGIGFLGQGRGLGVIKMVF